MNPAMNFEAILGRIENLVAQNARVQDTLDELVVDEYLEQASVVNNCGLEEQLLILLQTRSADELISQLGLPPNIDRR